MSEYLCISAKFLDPRFHGRGDRGQPEWPPSPLRLFQSMVAANADHIGNDTDLDCALRWLERQPPPIIIAPQYDDTSCYCVSVPNNTMDLVGKHWNRGNYFGSGDASPATHRTMKTVRPVRMKDGDTVYYCWTVSDTPSTTKVEDTLISAARRMVALGWGIDLVVGQGCRRIADRLADLAGEHWKPSTVATGNALRIPIQGTFDALQKRYDSFIRRIRDDDWMPVNPLSKFEMVGYRRATDPLGRPTAVFELRREDGEFLHYPQRKLIHLAGMVRHEAIALMKRSPPADVDDGWIERYVAGHRNEAFREHRQFSYLPIPSLGHRYVDQGVRRIMIAAPIGDDAFLQHLARRLEGRQLIPERGEEFGEQGPPTLVRIYRDGVTRNYTDLANRWASVTPVILPGHNDHKPAKTKKLIVTALGQAGIDQPCTFEWSTFSRFPKSLSAHKYDRDKKPSGYIRPDHLSTQTAVHLTLQFNDGNKVFGPLVIGSGCHCGLGVFAADENVPTS